MFGLRFSKLPEHRKYSYTPVYYNEESEELHSRVAELKREMGEEEYTQESVEDSIRNAFKAKARPNRYSANSKNRFYGLKILLIAVILGYILFTFLNSDIIETIFEGLL